MTNHTIEENDVFDFVIIGSGFGGSVSALRLSQKGYRVLVLERGKRYQAEDFPKTNWNIRKYLWLPSLRCFGFMGINFFKDIMIMNGSGVGGGSLVYAATLIQPKPEFFETEGWRGLAEWEEELLPHYKTARRMLGVTLNPKMWPADHLFREIAAELGHEETFELTPLGIYFGDEGVTVADPYFDGQGPERTGCINCGGCMSGCRYDAKNSLDKNYLYLAERLGTIVQPEANVTDIRPLYGPQKDSARYQIVYERTTSWIVKPQSEVRARNVVVSGGVLGTLDLLLHCRDETHSLPKLSPQLGRMVRSNSEAFMGVTAREETEDFSLGPAITSHFWIDEVTSVEPVRFARGSSFIRTIAVPLIKLDGNTLERLGRFVSYAIRHPYNFLKIRLLPDWARDTTIIMVMQTIENRMHMKRGRSIWTLFRKGLVTERDRRLPIPAVIKAGRKVVDSFANRINGIPGSTFNEVLLDTPVTAHILGGCAIGRDEKSGVVDVNHQVFNYPGMYIADASVIPGNLGVNPSLTITAMTERAMSRIPAAEEIGDYEPLRAPAGYQLNGHGPRRKLRFPGLFAVFAALLVVPLLLYVVKSLAKSR